MARTPPAPDDAPALTDADLQRLQTLLDSIPEPLEPLDASMLDGYLCGVLLQPKDVPAGAWARHVWDVDGRPLPANWPALNELQGLVARRHRELARAIAQRQWFDPWVFEMDDEASPLETTLPWVAGFAAAMALFPALMEMNAPEALEPLAVLYASFSPEDLEDAEDLIAEIETLEPPAELSEAIEDLVASVLRLADVGRPRPAASSPGRGPGPRRSRH